MSTLAKALLQSMLDPVLKTYGEWIDVADQTLPVNKDISFSIIKEGTETKYVFKVCPLVSVVTITAVWRAGEYIGCNIDADGLIGTMGEYMEVMNDLVFELHGKLVNHAAELNMPAPNMLLYPDLSKYI